MLSKGLFLILAVIPLNTFAYTKAPIDITKQDLSSLSYYLEEGVISSETLVNLYLERIKEYSDYNAIISINNNAINEAKQLDEERTSGHIRSKIHGIPIIVKDNIDVFGMPTTAGAASLKDNYPQTDATVIAKLKEAGAIILAKSNMSEFAISASSSRSSYGTVKNAYNKNYSAYGSSGGSSTSVALNLAPAALGTDTNSSVRIPASSSNLVGYRPTVGTISRSGVLPYDPERDTVGTLTKNIEDSIILTNIINGYDEKDYKSLNQKSNYNLTLNSLNNITIGIPTNFLKGSNDNKLPENKETYSEIYDLMLNAINKMEANGATIVYIDPYYTTKEDNLVANSYSGFLFCDSFNKYLENTTGTIRSFNDLYNSKNKISDLTIYAKNCQTTRTLDEKNTLKESYRDYLSKIFKENNLDVIVYPTSKNKLLKVGTTGLVNTSAHASSTINYPSISMPLGFDSDNLPYGIEFMVPTNKDNKLFNIAYQYEKISDINAPIIATNLYEIDKEVTTLLNNYQNLKPIFFKKIWQNKVKNYFKYYNDDSNYLLNAQKLNQEYSQKIFLLRLIKIIFILLIYLYFIRKFRK